MKGKDSLGRRLPAKCVACAKIIPAKRAQDAISRGKVPRFCSRECRELIHKRRHRKRVDTMWKAIQATCGHAWELNARANYRYCVNCGSGKPVRKGDAA